MGRRLLTLLALFALGLAPQAVAQKAELFVFEPGLERIVGYGVTSGTEFRLTLNAYQGPVTALWSREGQSPASFTGSVSNGQLRITVTAERALQVKDFLVARGVESRLVVNQTGNREPIANPRSNSGSGSSRGDGGKTGGDGKGGGEGRGGGGEGKGGGDGDGKGGGGGGGGGGEGGGGGGGK